MEGEREGGRGGEREGGEGKGKGEGEERKRERESLLMTSHSICREYVKLTSRLTFLGVNHPADSWGETVAVSPSFPIQCADLRAIGDDEVGVLGGHFQTHMQLCLGGESADTHSAPIIHLLGNGVLQVHGGLKLVIFLFHCDGESLDAVGRLEREVNGEGGGGWLQNREDHTD